MNPLPATQEALPTMSHHPVPPQGAEQRDKVVAMQSQIKQLGQNIDPVSPMQQIVTKKLEPKGQDASPLQTSSPVDAMVVSAHLASQTKKRASEAPQETVKVANTAVTAPFVDKLWQHVLEIETALLTLFPYFVYHLNWSDIFPHFSTATPHFWDDSKQVIEQVSFHVASLVQITKDPHFKLFSSDRRGAVLGVVNTWTHFRQFYRDNVCFTYLPTGTACRLLGMKESDHRPQYARVHITEKVSSSQQKWNPLVEILFFLFHSPECCHEHLNILLETAEAMYQDRRFYGEIAFDQAQREICYFSFTFRELLSGQQVVREFPFAQMQYVDVIFPTSHSAEMATNQDVETILMKRILSGSIYRLFSFTDRKELEAYMDTLIKDSQRAERIGIRSAIVMEAVLLLQEWKKQSLFNVSLHGKTYQMAVSTSFLPLEIFTRFLLFEREQPIQMNAALMLLKKAFSTFIPVQTCSGVVSDEAKKGKQELFEALKKVKLSLCLQEPEKPFFTFTLAELEANAADGFFLRKALEQALQPREKLQKLDDGVVEQQIAITR